MDFYTIVIIVAVVLLIVSLTAIGLLITKTNSNAKFPGSYSSCPDYWSFDGKKCSANGINTNNGKYTSYEPDSDLCKNFNWAYKNKISWDGVINANSCKITT
uniref:CPW-WPC domain-containing protein n=1 Tax=viral metagenome TaxID=1070528 RepID=A0A6C0I005_9ZZZZ